MGGKNCLSRYPLLSAEVDGTVTDETVYGEVSFSSASTRSVRFSNLLLIPPTVICNFSMQWNNLDRSPRMSPCMSKLHYGGNVHIVTLLKINKVSKAIFY